MPSSPACSLQHLALAVDGGQHVAPVVGDGQLDDVGERAQPVADR